MPGKVTTQKEIDRAVQRDQYTQDTEAAGNATEQRRLTVVVAFNAADFDQWCKVNGKNARDRNLLMATPASARGLQNAHIEITSRGMWRADIHALMVALVPMLESPLADAIGGRGVGSADPLRRIRGR